MTGSPAKTEARPSYLRKRLLVGGALVAACAGGLAAFTAVYAAWQHNPQQAFHSDTYIRWADLAFIGMSWFLVIGVGLFVALAVVVLAAHGFRKWLGRSSQAPDSGEE